MFAGDPDSVSLIHYTTRASCTVSQQMVSSLHNKLNHTTPEEAQHIQGQHMLVAFPQVYNTALCSQNSPNNIKLLQSLLRDQTKTHKAPPYGTEQR